ncbi:ion channel [Marivirga sp.]|uniref:ion channel n=1 Tax=Marivirga sp. TaxID=2018662 RepID=UPI00345D39CA
MVIEVPIKFGSNNLSFYVDLGIKPLESLNYLFEAFYFSVVIFATIGYRNIVPETTPANIFLRREIDQSFVLLYLDYLYEKFIFAFFLN